MPGYLLSVESDYSFIIGCTEINEGPPVFLDTIVKDIPVPDCTFIIIKIITLRIPVAGDHQSSACIEIIFIKDCPVRVEIPVHKIRGLFTMRSHPVTVVSVFIRVHDCLPQSVQRHCLPSVHIHDLRCGKVLSGIRDNGDRQQCCKKKHVFHNIKSISFSFKDPLAVI